MPPARIVFIRHAEQHGATGVDEDGERDAHSLTVRGWQRAGALARLLLPRGHRGEFTPAAVFASRIGPGSETRRPQQTAAPLVALRPALPFDTRFLKTEIEALVAAVLECSGIVLVVWEHSMIASCVAGLPYAPATPDQWPGDRYDLLWLCDRVSERSWTFEQRSQLLLAGDR